MSRRALLVLAGALACASCVQVADVFTCTSDAQCTGASQGRCETSGNCSFADVTCGSDGFRYDASAGPRAGICVLADEVTSADLDFTNASDHVDGNCSSDTPDVSFEVTLKAVQTIAIDSPGAGTAIAVYAGSCPPATPSAGMCTDMPCHDPTYDRNVQTLAAGTYCIVAEKTGSGTSGQLRMFPINGPAILPVTSPTSGNTCGHPPNVATPSCFTQVGPSVPMLFWQCPTSGLQLAATVAPEAGLDLGLTLRDASDGSEVSGECVNSGGSGANEQLHGSFPSPGPYWLMIDGAGGGAMQCGAFSVNFSIE